MSDGDALEVLRHEDETLVALFTELAESRGGSITERASHGDRCKHLIRRIAVREAAKGDIVAALVGVEQLRSEREQLVGDIESRRSAIDDLATMGRHVKGIELNRTQDFDAAVDRLCSAVGPEIDWELAEGIPAIRRGLPADRRSSLHGAHYLRHHAPTMLNRHSFRWYERVSLIARVLTAWDHLEDRPRPIRGEQVE